ncbi:zinc-finger double domain-containing protein [Phthorimaea operculella]|nr:zinc-finger double domain-containing protein [Phthorimaea operculella]
MVNEADLNMLVSNVLSENHFKHCRLCLRDIQDANFVRFEDCVCLEETMEFLPMVDIVRGLLNQEVCQDIPGVNAVCSTCATKCIESWAFLQHCKQANATLHKIFDNLYNVLNIEIEDDANQQLYVIVGEEESKVVLKDKVPTSEVKKEEPKLKCTECNLLFDSEQHLNIHFKNNHTFICALCHQQMCSQKSLLEHHDRFHELHVCKECGKSCTGLDKLEIHEKRHGSTKLKCPKCNKEYITQSSYENHVELCLAEKIEPHPYRGNYEKKYFCEKCGKGYSTTGGLRVHERFEHGNAKPHICEYCGKKFTAPSYLKIHMVTHTGEKHFTCNICSKSFVSKEALLYHTRRHTGEKPFSCKLCSEKFVNASTRAEHIKYKHSRPMLPCDICQRHFFTSSFLKQHRKRHFDPLSKLFAGRITTVVVEGESISENFTAGADMSEESNP